METLEQRLPLTTLTSVSPEHGSHVAPLSTNVVAHFDQDVTGGRATPQTFSVHSMQRGRLVGSAANVSVSGSTVILDPTTDFFPGELVEATVTNGIQCSVADPPNPFVWRFQTGVQGGSGVFTAGQDLEVDRASGVALGDLDGDGDLDAFITTSSPAGDTTTGANRVWLNHGGVFSDSGQRLGNRDDDLGALGDFDGDGDLDVFVVGDEGNRVWVNDGGVFTDSGQVLGSSRDVSLGDIDKDGDLDALTTDRLWINDGGRFSGEEWRPREDGFSPHSISVGDLDADGDLDAFVSRNDNNGHRVWLNIQGLYGVEFVDTGQRLGPFGGRSVALGDLDADGDLDAFVANGPFTSLEANRVWLNDGTGSFTDSGQSMGNQTNYGFALGDLDGDGDLDALANTNGGKRIWVNNGEGRFTDSGRSLGIEGSSLNMFGSALGDVDGDGDLDALFVTATPTPGGQTWTNQQDGTNQQPTTTLIVDNATIGEAGGAATLTATLSMPASKVVTVELSITGTATLNDDYTVSGTQIVIPIGSRSELITLAAVQDMLDEPDETVVVDIANVTNAQESGVQQVTTTILDDDEPPRPDVTLAVDSPTIAEAAGIATFTITLSQSTTLPVTVDLQLSGTATAVGDYTASATQVVIAPGSTSGSVTVTAVQDQLNEPDETVIVDIAGVAGGNESGTQQQTITIVDDDAPPSFAVSELQPTASGFRVEFNNPPDFSNLNLYDTQNADLGPADVVLNGATSGAVAGSLVVNGSAVSFIKSGEPLAADTYTVTLRSADNGFKRADGVLLDGDGNGTPGGDFTETFTVAPTAANAITVSLPDFVRGPGQDINLPAAATTGIPLSISDGTGVRRGVIEINYDPTLLTITGATPGPDLPAGATVELDPSTAGTAILVVSSPNDLPAGKNTLVNLQANVPDVSGNRRINAADASQVARVAALLDTGFAGSPTVDPALVGDISGNGRINAADAALLARFVALIDVPEIPPSPGGAVIAMPGVADRGPALSQRSTLQPGSSSQVPQDRWGAPADAPFAEPDPVVIPPMDGPGEAVLEADHDWRLVALEDAISDLLSAELLGE